MTIGSVRSSSRERQIEHAVHACRIGRQRQPDHLAHREVHQDKHENRRNDNTGLHFLQRLVRLRASRRSRCLPAVVHRSRVAAGLDRLYNRLCVARIFVVLDRHAAGEQIYLHAADTRHRRNAFLHMGGAGRAAHAAHPKPLFHIGISDPAPLPHGRGFSFTDTVYTQGTVLSTTKLVLTNAHKIWYDICN